MRMEGERRKAWHIGLGKGGRPSSRGSHLRGFWCLLFFLMRKNRVWEREVEMTQGGRQSCRRSPWASTVFPTSAKIFSRPHPPPTTCDFVAAGMGRADGTLQEKGCAEWQGLRISNLFERLKAQLVDFPASHLPQKDCTCV